MTGDPTEKLSSPVDEKTAISRIAYYGREGGLIRSNRWPDWLSVCAKPNISQDELMRILERANHAASFLEDDVT